MDLWKEAKFIDRLSNIFDEIFIIDNNKRVGNLRSFDSMHDVLSQINVDEKYICFVDPSQLFIDKDVVNRGLKRLAKKSVDYFTQWEHVNLPIGIGIRAFSIDFIRSHNCTSFQDAFDILLKSPDKFDCYYDTRDKNMVDGYKFDSRINTGNLKLINQINNWSFIGFTDLIEDKKLQDNFIINSQPLDNKTSVDEHFIPTPFGFESIQCADFPNYIMFDMTNKCNALCVHCPQSEGFAGQEHMQFLDSDIFRRVIDECTGKPIDFVRITADGEPLLHPDIWELIKYAVDNQDGPVGLTTNGSALNKKNRERLIESDIFMVDISLDAFSQNTFEEIRVGLDYDKTISNVIELINDRERMNSNMKIMVSFVKQKGNIHEVDLFQDFWQDKVDDVLIREMISNVGINDIRGSVAELSDQKRWPCAHLFRRVVINYDGKLKGCPIDWQCELSYGPIEEESIQKIWHSDFYYDHRSQHLNLDIDKKSICHDCRDWKGTPWNLGYEKVIKKLTYKE